MKKTVFDYRDYKRYILDSLQQLPQRGRGMKLNLAKRIGCQSAYVSRVLNADAHFSLEQADLVNLFFNHTKDESKFFLLLVEVARAGTHSLKNHFEEEISKILEHRLVLKNRLGVKQILSELNQSKYYSSWLFAAVHIALTIRSLQTKEALSSHFQVPVSQISDAVDFLVSVGLAQQDKSRFKIGTQRIHLGNDSEMLTRHHTNWRLQSIRSFERSPQKNLHYSSVVSLSEKDALAIRDLLISYIQNIKEVIRKSPEEVLYCFSSDFFNL